MKRQPLVVQLFNGRGRNSKCEPKPKFRPDHTREEKVLEEAGFKAEMIAIRLAMEFGSK